MARHPNSTKNLQPPWKPGQPSPNPQGRPRTFKAFRECVLDFLNSPSSKKRTKLEKMMQDMTRTQQGRRVLLEYGFGRVPQPIVGAGEGPVQIEGFEKMLRKVYGPLHK